MREEIFVPRPDDAARVASLLNPDPLLGESAGLFLAAPRRTGKSTFLRRDLTPALEARGDLVLYVDLWADRSSDPADLITACLVSALEEHDKPIAKLRRNVPFNRVGALGFSVELKSAGTWSGTIPDALELLAEAAGSDVVLVVDEAQQALESEAGRNAMYALKAARDAVNQQEAQHRLYLVLTGSHRDKLAALVHDQQAPFFGARIRDFPPLGPEYSRAVAARVNARLADTAQVSEDAVAAAFAALDRRPEILNDCLRDLVFASDVSGDGALERLVVEKRKDMESALVAEIGALKPMQRALLRLMAAEGIAFAPFSEETLSALQEEIGGPLPSTGAVQKALADLRERGFVWRPGRGTYVLDNADVAQVLRGS